MNTVALGLHQRPYAGGFSGDVDVGVFAAVLPLHGSGLDLNLPLQHVKAVWYCEVSGAIVFVAALVGGMFLGRR
jgi:hypothetical protein